MLALFFELGEEVFAIPARFVVEVVPKVDVHRLAKAPPWLTGMFAYRGAVLPVVDLCRRVFDTEHKSRLSSRIVVVDREQGDPSGRYGILVEGVKDVRPLAAAGVSSVELADAPFVRGTVLDAGTLVQLLDIDKLLPRELMLQRGLEI